MTEDNPGDDVFDVERIRQLVELMKDHELNEIDLRHANQRIRLARGATGGISVSTPGVATPVPQPIAAPSAPPAAAPSAPAAEEGNFEMIKSPMVGTFYSKPNPDAAPFLKVGDSVGPESVVCIIEAMKNFCEIQAECSGKIVEILVSNGEPVDTNKPLFKVKTS